MEDCYHDYGLEAVAVDKGAADSHKEADRPDKAVVAAHKEENDMRCVYLTKQTAGYFFGSPR